MDCVGRALRFWETPVENHWVKISNDTLQNNKFVSRELYWASLHICQK